MNQNIHRKRHTFRTRRQNSTDDTMWIYFTSSNFLHNVSWWVLYGMCITS
ncbi:hypothetical protein RhiirA5_367018 [Rhizophagus irregularis]|uniref:Uncharacterized protein n=1 Tax=Rhizophagus irregularis TaxID=588596 RepID=A0A2I1FD74_9GLOM|nr:hypothetical protein RhiirA5_367018 [Rhizophagus irregularis]PKY32335.1 hypothetical protein RhiirB3_420082 [Rhizophagus irregularis]